MKPPAPTNGPPAADLLPTARRVAADLEASISRIDVAPRVSRVGRVVHAADGVARAHDHEARAPGELMDIEGTLSRVESVRRNEVSLVLLGEERAVEAGQAVRPVGRDLEVPAGSSLIGRVVDPIGYPIDGLGPLENDHRVLVDGEPIPLAAREPVDRPLRTGVFVVDTMVPVGRGQRQLIVGDRGTGKTSLALDILAALDPDTVGVFVAIGRRGSDVARNLDWLRRRDFFRTGFAVVADADQPIGLIHLAPYAACSMAEDLMLAGKDVVIVFDDLTTHAHAHRTLALLLGRPVGREAFPVDVFYAHARLLERAAQLGTARGGGSMTAFPIVETQGGDLSAYIPTNIVSITDGQIRLDANLAVANQRPAVDIGLSVSRVGGKAQPPRVRKLAGNLKNEYALFLELEEFTRFGTQLETSAQRRVEWGRRVRAALRQPLGAPSSWAATIARLILLGSSEIERIPVSEVDAALPDVAAKMARLTPNAWAQLEGHACLDDASFDEFARRGRATLADYADQLARRGGS